MSLDSDERKSGVPPRSQRFGPKRDPTDVGSTNILIPIPDERALNDPKDDKKEEQKHSGSAGLSGSGASLEETIERAHRRTAGMKAYVPDEAREVQVLTEVARALNRKNDKGETIADTMDFTPKTGEAALYAMSHGRWKFPYFKIMFPSDEGDGKKSLLQLMQNLMRVPSLEGSTDEGHRSIHDRLIDYHPHDKEKIDAIVGAILYEVVECSLPGKGTKTAQALLAYFGNRMLTKVYDAGIEKVLGKAWKGEAPDFDHVDEEEYRRLVFFTALENEVDKNGTIQRLNNPEKGKIKHFRDEYRIKIEALDLETIEGKDEALNIYAKFRRETDFFDKEKRNRNSEDYGTFNTLTMVRYFASVIYNHRKNQRDERVEQSRIEEIAREQQKKVEAERMQKLKTRQEYAARAYTGVKAIGAALALGIVSLTGFFAGDYSSNTVNRKLEQEIQQVRQEQTQRESKYQTERGAIDKQIADLSIKVTELTSKVTEYEQSKQGQTQTETSRAEQLKEQYQALQQENTALRTRLEALELASTQSAAQEETNRRFDSIEAAIVGVQSTATIALEKTQQGEQHNESIAGLQVQINELRSAATNTITRAEVQEITQAALTNASQTTGTSAADQYKTEIQEVKDKINALEKSVHAAQEQIKNYSENTAERTIEDVNRYEELSRSIDALSQATSSMTTRLADAEVQIATTQALDSAREKHLRSWYDDKVQADYNRLNAQIEELKKQVNALDGKKTEDEWSCSNIMNPAARFDQTIESIIQKNYGAIMTVREMQEYVPPMYSTEESGAAYKTIMSRLFTAMMGKDMRIVENRAAVLSTVDETMRNEFKSLTREQREHIFPAVSRAVRLYNAEIATPTE